MKVINIFTSLLILTDRTWNLKILLGGISRWIVIIVSLIEMRYSWGFIWNLFWRTSLIKTRHSIWVRLLGSLEKVHVQIVIVCTHTCYNVILFNVIQIWIDYLTFSNIHDAITYTNCILQWLCLVILDAELPFCGWTFIRFTFRFPFHYLRTDRGFNISKLWYPIMAFLFCSFVRKSAC